MEYKLSPSILSADFCNLEEGIRQTEENGAVYLHFDVMDGVFVPSISFGMPVLASIKTGGKAGDRYASDDYGTNPLCGSICRGRSGYSYCTL